MNAPRIVKSLPFAFSIMFLTGVGGGLAVAGVIIAIVRNLP